MPTQGRTIVVPSEMYGSVVFFFSSRRRHTRFDCDWSSDVCSSDLSGSYRPADLGSRPLATITERKTRLDGSVVDYSCEALVVEPGRRAVVRYVAEQEIGRASCRERV